MYEVEYRGERMTILQYSRLVGICESTLRNRVRRGLPVVQSQDAEIARKWKEKQPVVRDRDKYGYKDGYTREEIEELYGHFAGAPNELRILMDFTGLGYIYAEKLLKELKEKRRRKS